MFYNYTCCSNTPFTLSKANIARFVLCAILSVYPFWVMRKINWIIEFTGIITYTTWRDINVVEVYCVSLGPDSIIRVNHQNAHVGHYVNRSRLDPRICEPSMLPIKTSSFNWKVNFPLKIGEIGIEGQFGKILYKLWLVPFIKSSQLQHRQTAKVVNIIACRL